MDTNKMREQFEEAWAYAKRNDEGVPGSKPLRSLEDPERYRGSAVNGAWYWWKLSREAVVMELPADDGMDGHLWAPDVVAAIEAQGLKVAP